MDDLQRLKELAAAATPGPGLISGRIIPAFSVHTKGLQ